LEPELFYLLIPQDMQKIRTAEVLKQREILAREAAKEYNQNVLFL